MRNGSVVVVCLAALAIGAAGPAVAQDGRLTLDWVFSDEGKSAASVPRHAWIDSGLLILYDPRPPKGQRTLESFDPETGERRALVDPAKARSALTALLEPEKPIEELGWPDALDPRGRWAVYEKQDDVGLLDLESSDVVAVGRSAAVEKSARFSPDGRSLAFVRDNDLYVWDLEARKERRLTTDGSATLLNGTLSWVYWEEIFDRNDEGYWWSPDSKSIAFLQTDESGVALTSFVDFEPYVPRVIQQRYPKAGEANPRVRAGVLDLGSGKTTWIDLGAYPYEYLVRVTWLPDGKRLAVQTLDRQQTTLDLFLADAATGEVTHVLRETGEGWINLHDDLHFLEDGRRFVWCSERDGYAHLYLYDIDGTLVRQITKGAWPLSVSGASSRLGRAVALIDERNDWLYFTALEASSIEDQLYRIHLDGSGLERLTRERGTHAVVFRADGKYYADAYSAFDRLPSLAVHRPGGELVSTVAEPRPELFEPLDLLPRELFTIPAAGGFEMPAMILKPSGFDPSRKHPVVIYVYGGPSSPTVADAWGGRARDYFEHILAHQGFIVLRVDNRSATAKSKTLENRILNEGCGATELADLLDAVRWLKSQPYVDPERVGIWGWSGGGSFTLLAMTASKEFKAGVAVAAVSDWRYYDTKFTEAFMKRPQDNPEGYDRTSHAARAKELHGRLLLVHGTYDDNVHPQNAWRFADELIEAGITFDMMVYPMRKHGIDDDAAQKHLYATMLEFWTRNLKM